MAVPKEGAAGNMLLGKYQLGRLLGRGTYAKVYHGKSMDGGAGVAVKVIDKSRISGTSMEPRIVREISVMRRLINHPNVVRLHEVLATRSKIYIVMEHCRGGDLFSQIVRDGPLSESGARRHFQQLISAVRHCHANGVTHRDLKAQNILLDQRGDIKVSDFGLSALPEQRWSDDGLLHTSCGTPAYTAPEVVRRKGYDGAKADAWSCGVVLFLLLAGNVPFSDASLTVMYQKMCLRDYEFPAWVSRSARKVISRLLDPNPDTRISIEELTQLSWFKKSLQQGKNSDVLDNFSSPSDLKTAAKSQLPMNAFDIISLSPGLDLSGLFEGEMLQRQKRFTTAESGERISERLEGLQGFKVERRKEGSVLRLAKEQLIIAASVSEVSPSLRLVEVKAVVDNGSAFEKVFQEEIRPLLEILVLEWHRDGY